MNKEFLLIAGHGGNDPGACNGRYKEAALTRELVSNLYYYLSKYAKVQVFDTLKDCYTYLKSNSFNFKRYTYVLEVHFNAGGGKGCEVLVHANEQGVSVEEKILAAVTSFGFANRGIKHRTNLLVQNTVHAQGVSHALLEVCFIDSGADMLMYEQNKSAISKSIGDAILDGFGIEKEDDDMKDICNSINDVPDYAKPTIEKLVNAKVLLGDEKGLNLSEDLIRILVILDRAGAFDGKK